MKRSPNIGQSGSYNLGHGSALTAAIGLLLYLALLINLAAFLYSFTALVLDSLSSLACLLWRGLTWL